VFWRPSENGHFRRQRLARIRVFKHKPPPVEAKNREAALARMDYAPLGNEKRRQNGRFFEET